LIYPDTCTEKTCVKVIDCKLRVVYVGVWMTPLCRVSSIQ